MSLKIIFHIYDRLSSRGSQLNGHLFFNLRVTSRPLWLSDIMSDDVVDSSGIWTNLFGSLFRIRVHGTMKCCGSKNSQEVIFYFLRKDKLVL